MVEPTEIRLSSADLLAELALGTMARQIELGEDDEVLEAPAEAVGWASEQLGGPAQPKKQKCISSF